MLKRLAIFLIAAAAAVAVQAQAMFIGTARVADSTRVAARITAEVDSALRNPNDSIPLISRILAEWNLFEVPDTVTEAGIFADFNLPYDTLMYIGNLRRTAFLPCVFRSFEFRDTLPVFAPDFSGIPEKRWIEESEAQERALRRIQHDVFYSRPDVVRYNLATLPEAPKVYHAVVNPEEHTIKFEKLANEPKPKAPTVEGTVVERRHWIRQFDVGLQFSQAYVSPNWYQGGNSNLNMIGNVRYNVELNQAYHPNLIFQTTFQYKVGVNNAPDDTIHNYNISEDVFQVNTTFGVKAARSWYYSFTGRLKTQLLNNYPTNSRNLRSAFMSPGEVTVGIGMTYNYHNPKKTVTFDASIAPLSYNLKTCLNSEIDPGRFGIEKDRKTKSDIGSSTELKFYWKLCYNITYRSRVFAFTDYETFTCDWENTVIFEINRYLTTQINANLRYDAKTPTTEDSSWKKLQLKEILSIGFAYKFASV